MVVPAINLVTNNPDLLTLYIVNRKKNYEYIFSNPFSNLADVT
jgi:hypothetical protein